MAAPRIEVESWVRRLVERHLAATNVKLTEARVKLVLLRKEGARTAATERRCQRLIALAHRDRTWLAAAGPRKRPKAPPGELTKLLDEFR
jgi:hypothetical protein